MAPSLKSAVTALALLSAPASSSVVLMSYDGADGAVALSKFNELNDPVMGGQSTGTFVVDDDAKVGVFDGEVADVPSLSAPGFIKAAAAGSFPDASAAGVDGSLVLTVRTTTPDYAGFRVSIAGASTASPSYSCSGGGSIPFSRGCFKAPFTVPAAAAGDDFVDVAVPFASFSDLWSPATGDITTACADDASACVDENELAGIKDVEVWAEGALGSVHLEILRVSVVPAAAVAAPAMADDCEFVYQISDDDVCGDLCLSSTIASSAVKFGPVDAGDCADLGYTVADGTSTVDVGPFGSYTVNLYTKPAATAPASGSLRGFKRSTFDGTCPGSSASLFHTGMKITTTAAASCATVSAELEARVAGQYAAWHDPHNNGTYADATFGGDASFTRVTGDLKYTDKMIFTLVDGADADSCVIQACSESQVTSLSDFGTNYCNLKMLYCGSADGCVPVGSDFTVGEETTEGISMASVDLSACLQV